MGKDGAPGRNGSEGPSGMKGSPGMPGELVGPSNTRFFFKGKQLHNIIEFIHSRLLLTFKPFKNTRIDHAVLYSKW